MKSLPNIIRNNSFFQIVNRAYTLYKLADDTNRRYIITLHFISFIHVFISLVNVASGASILIFLKTPEIIYENKYFSAIYEYLEFQNFDHFLVALIGLTILIFIFNNLLNILIKNFSIYSRASIKRDLTLKIFNFHLAKKYEDRITTSLDEFLQKGITATGNAATETFSMSEKLIASAVNLIFIIIALLMLNVYFTVILIISLTLFYKFVMSKTKHRFQAYGKKNYQLERDKIKTLQGGFSGITDIILMGKERNFIAQINKTLINLASILVKRNLLVTAPPIIIQSCIYIIIFLVAAYFLLYNKSLSFSTLVIFAAATFRLLPIIGILYNTTSKVANTTYLYNQIVGDLIQARDNEHHITHTKIQGNTKIKTRLDLKNICYQYPTAKANEYAIYNMGISIPAGHSVALFGHSGAGKSTITRIIAGIIKPSRGKILVDGKPILDDNKLIKKWQHSISYIEQKPFFLDASIAANIAFQVNEKEIDYAKVAQVIRVVELEGFIQNLPQGLKTPIGNNAIMISGGQAQRVSIARALYRDTDLLIMDEATNSLDSVTANVILRRLTKKQNRTIILITHNLETLKQIDCIYVISNGTIVDQGSYDELLKNSPLFRALAAPYTTMEIRGSA